MPYIPQSERETSRDFCFTPGRLNYEISMLCAAYLQRKGINYTHLNDVIGALESAKLEFYNRIVSLYEVNKQMQNGDLPEYQELQAQCRALF